MPGTGVVAEAAGITAGEIMPGTVVVTRATGITAGEIMPGVVLSIRLAITAPLPECQ